MRPSSPVLAALLLLPALAPACSRSAAGPVKTETRTVSGFTQVALAGLGELTIERTGTESLTIEAEESILPRLTSDVANGRLTLGTKGEVHEKAPVRYHLTVKSLDAIDVSGASKVVATGIDADTFKLHVEGVGDVTLAGTAAREEITLSGASTCDASKLATKDARVSVDGTGHAVVAASDTLDAQVDGVGAVQYVGSPKVTQRVGLTGTVSRL
jgi:hypothetical protein